jgi:hypothetical protein
MGRDLLALVFGLTGPKVRLDMGEFVIGGHGFGAHCAFMAAHQIQKVKGVWLNDPVILIENPEFY